MITSINEFRNFYENHEHGFEQSLENFLAKFPDDATSWAQATEEIREILYWMQEAHDFDDTIPVVGKDNCKTPAEWNQKYKAAIREGWKNLTDLEKKRLYNDYIKGWTNESFTTINEMSYASLQSEIEMYQSQLDQLRIDMEQEMSQFDDMESPEGVAKRDWYGREMNKLERKIETRKNYIDRLRSGRKTVSTSKPLTPGEITYQNKEYIVVAKNDTEVKLADIEGAATYQGKPIRVTNVEGDNIFINTWKDNGGFNNFAKKISINDIEGLLSVPVSEFQKQPKESKPKPDRSKIVALRNTIRTLNKNIDSVQPSLDKFKDRTPEEQAAIFKTRFKMTEDVPTIVAALKEMGLINNEVSEGSFADIKIDSSKGFPVTSGVLFDKLQNAIPNVEFLNVKSYGKWEIIDGEIKTNENTEESLSKFTIESKLKNEFGSNYIVAVKVLNSEMYHFRLYSIRNSRRTGGYK